VGSGSPGDANAEFRAQVDAFQLRDARLVEVLRSKGVDLDTPREIDFHFFAPSKGVALRLAAALRSTGAGTASIGDATSDLSEVSVTFTVMTSVQDVTAAAQVEKRIRLAASLGARHDGWGTSVKPRGG